MTKKILKGIHYINPKQGISKKFTKKITVVLEDRETKERTPMDVWICPEDMV